MPAPLHIFNCFEWCFLPRSALSVPLVQDELPKSQVPLQEAPCLPPRAELHTALGHLLIAQTNTHSASIC